MLVSAAADLVFIIAGRVNIIVIKAGPVVAPVCARITNRPGAMAFYLAVTITARRHTLADCGAGITTSTKFLFAIIGITAFQIIWNVITLNRIPATPSQKE
jgi:hypothetical protein